MSEQEQNFCFRETFFKHCNSLGVYLPDMEKRQLIVADRIDTRKGFETILCYQGVNSVLTRQVRRPLDRTFKDFGNTNIANVGDGIVGEWTVFTEQRDVAIEQISRVIAFRNEEQDIALAGLTRSL